MENDTKPKVLDERYYYSFYLLFIKCIHEGYSCKDARDMASLELTGKYFHPKEDE